MLLEHILNASNDEADAVVSIFDNGCVEINPSYVTFIVFKFTLYVAPAEDIGIYNAVLDFAY